MSHIAIDINHQDLTATVDLPLIARSVGEVTFVVTADESWDDYVITIVFSTAHVQKSCLYSGGEMAVPWEVLDQPGKLWISAVGYAENKRRPTAFMDERQALTICQNGAIEGGPPGEYMRWTDGQIYRCKADATVHGPDVLPGAWELTEVPA